jgi:hypothetical protein
MMQISSKLQVFMALNQNFLQAASVVYGLKQKFPQSYKCSWPQAKIASKL